MRAHALASSRANTFISSTRLEHARYTRRTLGAALRTCALRLNLPQVVRAKSSGAVLVRDVDVHLPEIVLELAELLVREVTRVGEVAGDRSYRCFTIQVPPAISHGVTPSRPRSGQSALAVSPSKAMLTNRVEHCS